ncbi:hypothetical protein MMC06_003117 [Schaereria dolodes]|nr:hypothetical protein [Schaereria dolodes]
MSVPWRCVLQNIESPYQSTCVPHIIPELRPFSIAGCIGIWLKEDDDFPLELFPGHNSIKALITSAVEIDEHLAADLQLHQIPKKQTLPDLASRYFPDTVYIPYISNQLVIELPELSVDAHYNLVERLPGTISKCDPVFKHHNGPLTTTELERSKQRQPKYLDGIFDDVKYIQERGSFFPGTMLSSKAEEIGRKLGDPACFAVAQGALENGINVGYVVDRIGTTSIGLCKLLPDMAFKNQFLEIDGRAKTLLHSDDVRFGDMFQVDSFVVGLQQLGCPGIRKEDLPGSGVHVAVVQGIHANSAPEIIGKTQIREGVCGSALVRAMAADTKRNVLGNGEIGGFMHWSDLRAKSMAGTLLCFCNALDELVDAGWNVMPVQS